MESLDAATMRQYDQSFEALTKGSVISRADCQPLFERAALPPESIEHIWSLADSEGAGALDRTGFHRLMHYTTLGVQGAPLPDVAGAARLAALTAEDAARYDGYFVLIDASGAGLVSRQQAEPLFERAALPAHTVDAIWALADVGRDGKLSRSEFSVAMHLATCVVQGGALPNRLPPHLEEAARSTAQLPATPAPLLASGGGGGGSLQVPMTPSELAHYRAIYLTAEPERGTGVSGSVGVRVFSQSGLPEEELAQIWELADLDADGRLVLDEFAIAMHLVTRRVAGESLPKTLPTALMPPFAWSAAANVADSLAGVASPPLSKGASMRVSAAAGAPPAIPAVGGAFAAPISAADRRKYEGVFNTVLRAGSGGYVEGDDARKFLSRSGLSNEELALIWELADRDEDGRLTLDEFAIAMHLVTRRVAGEKLPKTLPPALVPAAGGVPGSYQLTAEDRLLYGTAFESSVKEGERMPRSQAMRHMAKSGLDEEQLAHVLGLVSPPGSALSEIQFVIAMFLASKGTPLPGTLPASLAALLAGQPLKIKGISPPGSRSSPSQKAVSFAQNLAADVFAEPVEVSFFSADAFSSGPPTSTPTGMAAPSSTNGVVMEDWLLVAQPKLDASLTNAMAERRLSATIEGRNAAKEELLVARTQMLSRNRDADDLHLRIEAVEAQREACRKEHEWCLKRLTALRAQCEEYGSTLRGKQHDLHMAQIELEQVGNEVSSAQARMSSQLEEAQGLNASLEHAREEARALKQAQALLLQQAHVASKQVAPVRCELAQLQAEIAILKQQVEAAVAEGDTRTSSGGEQSVELAEVQALVDEARLRRQQLQDELHAVQSLNRRQRAASEATQIADARRELLRLREESARVSGDISSIRNAPPARPSSQPISPAPVASGSPSNSSRSPLEAPNTQSSVVSGANGGIGVAAEKRGADGEATVAPEGSAIDAGGFGFSSLPRPSRGGANPFRQSPTAAGGSVTSPEGALIDGATPSTSAQNGPSSSQGAMTSRPAAATDNDPSVRLAGGDLFSGTFSSQEPSPVITAGGAGGFGFGDVEPGSASTIEPSTDATRFSHVDGGGGGALFTEATTDAFSDTGRSDPFSCAFPTSSEAGAEEAAVAEVRAAESVEEPEASAAAFGDSAFGETGFGAGDAAFGSESAAFGAADAAFDSGNDAAFGGASFGEASFGGFGDESTFGGGDAAFGDASFGNDAAFGEASFGGLGEGFGEADFGGDAAFGGAAGGFEEGAFGGAAAFGDAAGFGAGDESGGFDGASGGFGDASVGFGDDQGGGFGDAAFGNDAAESAAVPASDFGASGFGDAGFGEASSFGASEAFGSDLTPAPAAQAAAAFDAPSTFDSSAFGASSNFGAGGFGSSDFGEAGGEVFAAAFSPAAAAPPAAVPPAAAPQAASGMEVVVQVTGVHLSKENVEKLGGRGGLAVAIDVLNADEEPPFIKAPINAKGVATLAFSNSYAACVPPLLETFKKAITSPEDEDSEVQFVVFALDSLYPHGEPDEEIGMASISLKKLRRRDRDHELGPLKLVGINGDQLGTITCGVTAVAAIKAIESSSGVSSAVAPIYPAAAVAPVAPAAPPAAPPALEVRAYTFGAGPLGLVLLDRDRGMGGVLVHDIDAGGQGANLGVPKHSLIVAVNEQDVSGLTRSSLVGMIKASGRPLTLKMQVPAGSAPAAASGGKWAQQMRELVEMGFADAAANLRALEVADGNVGDAAIQLSESLL